MVIRPVILSGGAGTRLWPLSREHYPKQLLPLVGDQTLLQQTALRLEGLPAHLTPAGEGEDEAIPPTVGAPWVVCNEEHRFLVAEQLAQVDRSAERIILERQGRNTAPALTLAALGAEPDAGHVVLLVMPADHVIQDQGAFLDAVATGYRLAREGYLVTFGIVPLSAHTGYGYIRMGAPLAATAAGATAAVAHRIGQFVEKPDAVTARGYLASGNFLWNSGIFMVRADVWLAEIARHRPAIAEACRAAYQGGSADGAFFRVDHEAFARCPSDSIDYAVMERISDTATASGMASAAVIPLAAGWSDVGSWPALWEISPRDEQGNFIKGDVLTHATQSSLLVAEHRFLATVGLKDLIVIETADAVLVSHKDHAQDVKEVVKSLNAGRRGECLDQRRVYRPWGTYEGVDGGERFQVKRIVVKPGAALSLQMHYHRAEHWIVVRGTARVTRGDEVFLLTENQSTYIPLGVRHRLENPGTLPLEIIEVQSGSYLGEDDIVRFDDAYGRTGEPRADEEK